MWHLKNSSFKKKFIQCVSTVKIKLSYPRWHKIFTWNILLHWTTWVCGNCFIWLVFWSFLLVWNLKSLEREMAKGGNAFHPIVKGKKSFMQLYISIYDVPKHWSKKVNNCFYFNLQLQTNSLIWWLWGNIYISWWQDACKLWW